MLVTLITPTGDRPVAFQKCCASMHWQSFQGAVQWIIVDDSHDLRSESTCKAEDFFDRPAWDKLLLLRDPDTEPSPRSLARNLRFAFPHVKGDVVLIIEDDDWYSPQHVADIVRRLEYADATGSGLQHYYHLPSRRYAEFVNEGSCLCQTGMRRELLLLLEDACELAEVDNNKGIDRRFWDQVRDRDLPCDLFVDRRDVVGIKGLPGRPGLGVGHNPRNPNRWYDDKDGNVLRDWVGQDAEWYLDTVAERQAEHS